MKMMVMMSELFSGHAVKLVFMYNVPVQWRQETLQNKTKDWTDADIQDSSQGHYMAHKCRADNTLYI